VATLAAAVASPAEPAPPAPKAEARLEQCRARLERAREELIQRGFAPTSDGDTATWLRVEEWPPGRLMLSLAMRVSADGAETGYYLIVYQAPRRPTTPWRYRKHRKCCDDHAAPEDNLVEFEWSRESRGRGANLSVVMFAEDGNTPEQRASRELFVSVARPAADDCLAYRPGRGRRPEHPLKKDSSPSP
jgi:hypothetical protein